MLYVRLCSSHVAHHTTTRIQTSAAKPTEFFAHKQPSHPPTQKISKSMSNTSNTTVYTIVFGTIPPGHAIAGDDLLDHFLKSSKTEVVGDVEGVFRSLGYLQKGTKGTKHFRTRPLEPFYHVPVKILAKNGAGFEWITKPADEAIHESWVAWSPKPNTSIFRGVAFMVSAPLYSFCWLFI